MLKTNLVRIAAPLRFQLEDAIRTAIGDGVMRPGDRLIERDLCERFGVSRPLLREALRRLEAERLVEISPNRGAHVVKPALEDAIDLCQVRLELEGMAASLAARFASDSAIEDLGRALSDMEAVLELHDPEILRKKKNHFYELLVTACGNPVLKESLSGLHIRIQLFRGASLAEQGRAEAATAELRDVYDAIKRRDPAAAREATSLHLRNAATTLARALARAEDRPLTEQETARLAAMS